VSGGWRGRVGGLGAWAFFVAACTMAAQAGGPEAGAGKTQRNQAKALGVPETRSVDLGAGVNMEFALIPAGEFVMGSPDTEKGRDGDNRESPQKRVKIGQAFYMGRHEVTQAQWLRVMGANPSRFKDGPDAARRPVESVSWNDCQAFLKQLNSRGQGVFRLPTEAEWEYACRAGTQTPFAFGETLSPEQANYDGSFVYGQGQRGVSREATTPAGSFAPNAWGLYDMHGNVWEWCQSQLYPYPWRGDDGRDSAQGKARVLRGGSWHGGPRLCRSAQRLRLNATSKTSATGFRVVMEIRSKEGPR